MQLACLTFKAYNGTYNKCKMRVFRRLYRYQQAKLLSQKHGQGAINQEDLFPCALLIQRP